MPAVLTAARLALVAVALAAVATACEPAPDAPVTLRARLTDADATSWDALDVQTRRALRAAALDAGFASWEVVVEGAPGDADPLTLLAAFDDARLRGGRDVVPIATFTVDDRVVRSETCRQGLAMAWAAPGDGAALRWEDGVPRGTLDGRLRGWLHACGLRDGRLEVVVVERAPFLAAVWPAWGTVFVHPALAGLLTTESQSAPPAPQLAQALHFDSLSACLDALAVRCQPCLATPGTDGCDDDLLTFEGFAPSLVSGVLSCNRLAELRTQHPWVDHAICGGHALADNDVTACIGCAPGDFYGNCFSEMLPIGHADEGLDNLSLYRELATFDCRHLLESCLAPDAVTTCDPVTPPGPVDPDAAVPGFETCVEALQTRCATCLASPDGGAAPADCSSVFPVSTLAEDCIDIGYPGFANASRVSMYCAWQSQARPSCLNAQQVCVREEIEVVSFDTLAQAYAPFADERSRQPCIDQVLACEAGEGIAIPENSDPDWRVQNRQNQQNAQETCDCGDDC